MRMPRVWFIVQLTSFATAMTVFPLIARCQAPESWDGKRVITKFGTELEPKPAGRPEARPNRHSLTVTPREREELLVFRVQETAGQCLRLLADVFNKRAYDSAIRDFGKAIQIEPTLATAYNSRGVAWSK